MHGFSTLSILSDSPWNYVNIRLEQVARTARKAADAVYRRELGLDIFHIQVLRVVDSKAGQPVSEIVTMSNLERTLVSRIISSLVRAGLLERTISEKDARKFLLELTAEGERLVRKANKLGDAMNNDLLSVLDPHEQKCLETCLSKLSAWRPMNPG
jgi:DNA-binding MarR family transcriptional regulator